MAETYQPTEEERKLIEKWNKRFNKTKNWRLPYQEKWLRMYKLYRAYRDKNNYAYDTKLMPPIAFEIVETVKPRLASAKMNIRVLPRGKDDVGSPSIEAWDDLIKYDLDVMNFDDRKIDWITSALIYGNGIAQLTWNPGEEDDGDPDLEIQDLWLFYPDPEATSLQDSKWEIVQIFKKKEQIIKEEETRGENKLYKNLEYVENKKITNDPRRERYEINTKKMGQIDTGGTTSEGEPIGGTTLSEKDQEEQVELWQIWDHETNKLIVIANRQILIRNDVNPYLNINNGRVFIDLPDHALLWELWGIGHIEPVETTINEIADSRNQAMDDIVYTLDPIRKVRKDAHLTADDIVHAPGAIWQLKRADDVLIERPPEISKQWLEKDEILRREIQTSLAISEYAMGLPKGTQEPLGKVELLLMQTNIRFSLLLHQFEIALTQLINNLIELNKEFITKDKVYRLVGKDIVFKEFKKEDKKVKIDAKVEIEPQVEETPEKRKIDIMELYKIFVTEDKPEAENIKEIEQWKIRKKTLQKKILEEFGMEEYEDLIIGKNEKEENQESLIQTPIQTPTPTPTPTTQSPTSAMPLGGEIPMTPITPPTATPAMKPTPRLTRRLAAKVPFIKRFVS